MSGLFSKEDANLKRNRKLKNLRDKQRKNLGPDDESARQSQGGAPPVTIYRGNRYLGPAEGE